MFTTHLRRDEEDEVKRLQLRGLSATEARIKVFELKMAAAAKLQRNPSTNHMAVRVDNAQIP